ncbi:MAG: VOC family protein [Victivallales bacterium]|nr:VOC family protein [Victivallales bacterium]
MFLGIDHPAVAAERPETLAQWYVDNLGYGVHTHTEKNVWILRAPDGTLLEVMPRDDTPRPARTTWTPGWSHLALRVANLEKASRELESKGIPLAPPVPAIGGGMLRNFTDPEGNMLQIVQRG